MSMYALHTQYVFIKAGFYSQFVILPTDAIADNFWNYEQKQQTFLPLQ